MSGAVFDEDFADFFLFVGKGVDGEVTGGLSMSSFLGALLPLLLSAVFFARFLYLVEFLCFLVTDG
jgi:hypothetical protein